MTASARLGSCSLSPVSLFRVQNSRTPPSRCPRSPPPPHLATCRIRRPGASSTGRLHVNSDFRSSAGVAVRWSMLTVGWATACSRPREIMPQPIRTHGRRLANDDAKVARDVSSRCAGSNKQDIPFRTGICSRHLASRQYKPSAVILLVPVWKRPSLRELLCRDSRCDKGRTGTVLPSTREANGRAVVPHPISGTL